MPAAIHITKRMISKRRVKRILQKELVRILSKLPHLNREAIQAVPPGRGSGNCWGRLP